jgi:hypothetical protein
MVLLDGAAGSGFGFGASSFTLNDYQEAQKVFPLDFPDDDAHLGWFRCCGFWLITANRRPVLDD